jgi:hypothetical protein
LKVSFEALSEIETRSVHANDHTDFKKKAHEFLVPLVFQGIMTQDPVEHEKQIQELVAALITNLFFVFLHNNVCHSFISDWLSSSITAHRPEEI